MWSLIWLGFHSIELNEPPLVHTAASLFKDVLPIGRPDGRNHHCRLGPPRRGTGVPRCPWRGMMVRQPLPSGALGAPISMAMWMLPTGRHDQGRMPAVHCQCSLWQWSRMALVEGDPLGSHCKTGDEVWQVLLEMIKFTIATLHYRIWNLDIMGFTYHH